MLIRISMSLLKTVLRAVERDNEKPKEIKAHIVLFNVRNVLAVHHACTRNPSNSRM